MRIGTDKNRGTVGTVFLGAGGLLVFSIAIIYWMGQLTLISTHMVANQKTILQQLDQFLSTLKDAETSQRGFLLTGQEAYLKPYTKVLAEIRSQLDGLLVRVSTGDLSGKLVAQVARLTDAKLAEMERTIAIRRDHGLEAALAVVRSGEDERIMGSIRAGVAELKVGEEEEYQSAARQVEKVTTARTVTFILAALVNLLFLVWAYWRISLTIGELSQARDDLRESEERYRGLFESMDEGFALCEMLYDASGQPVDFRYLQVNPAFEKLTGLTVEWVTDRRVRELIPNIEPSWIEAYGRVVQTGRSERFVNPVDELGRYYEVYAYRTGPEQFAVIINDVTVRKQAEDALKKFNVELEERVRERTAELEKANVELRRINQDLEQFTYVSSHDLQEPLRMVVSFVGLLAKRYQGKLDAKADDYIGYAVDGAKRMGTLIKDLREFSQIRSQGQPFAPTDCEKLLVDVMQNMESEIGQTQAQITHDSLPTVMADEAQLGLVFQNLIANALKFRKNEPVPQIHISAAAHDGEWVFSVRDNGIGIAPEHQERIFVIFQRLHTREKYPGTGIGLAVVKRIIERHGGEVRVDSKLGEGSTFYFTLPR